MTHDTSEELLPCPFCGGKATLMNSGMPGCRFVRCTQCAAASDDTNAVARWNTRAAAPAAGEAVAWCYTNYYGVRSFSPLRTPEAVANGFHEQPLYVAPSPQAALPGIEEIARVIDLAFFANYDAELKNGKPWAELVYGWRAKELFTTADAIIALFSRTLDK